MTECSISRAVVQKRQICTRHSLVTAQPTVSNMQKSLHLNDRTNLQPHKTSRSTSLAATMRSQGIQHFACDTHSAISIVDASAPERTKIHGVEDCSISQCNCALLTLSGLLVRALCPLVHTLEIQEPVEMQHTLSMPWYQPHLKQPDIEHSQDENH